MKAQGSSFINMPCESCAVQFSVFRRKRACCECERYYCSGCLRRGGGVMCSACRVLSTRPLSRQTIAHLKVRDIQCFLQRQNVSTRGCVEKEELVSLCVTHVNSAAYRRRGPRGNEGPFSTLKDFTKLINNAFDCRGPATPAPAPPPRPPHSHGVGAGTPARERFSTTPGGERALTVPVPRAASVSRSSSADSGARVYTDDCFEIEDLDDAGWEFVTRPAEPLPNDSEVLIAESNTPVPPPRTAPEQPEARDPPAPRPGGLAARLGGTPEQPEARDPPAPRPGGLAARLGGTPEQPEARDPPAPRPGGLAARLGGTPQRAASEMELPREREPSEPDSSSLQDEPVMERPTPERSTPKHMTLEQMQSDSELEALSVKQLKELLTRNRVAYLGCLERADLLERAKLLWRDHNSYKHVIDSLPLEECCKICMAAPLECVLLECGHIAACTACSKQLAECPICRQYVVRAVRFFRS